MAARHLDEGLLGWLLAAAALIGGLGACAFAGWIGHTVRSVSDAHDVFTTDLD